MRSLLRLVARASSGLRDFFCESCCHAGVSTSELAFNPGSPGGRYVLNLSKPHQRTTLRMLYKSCEAFGMNPNDAFENVVYSLPPYAHPSKDADGLWVVPTHGRLRFNFHTEPGMQTGFRGIEDHQFGAMIGRYYEITRIQPCRRKMMAICAHWKGLAGQPDDMEIFLNAMSQGFLLGYPEVSEFSTSHGGDVQDGYKMKPVHVAFMDSVVGGPHARYLVLLDTPSMGEYVKTHQEIQ